MKALMIMLTMVAAITLGTGYTAQAQGGTSKKGTEASGITFFEGTWSEALAAAKKQKKLIFVDAYAVWCPPCKYLANNVFTEASVGKFFNENFINYKFDMEKGEGPEFAGKYQVRAYPTLLFLNSSGEVVYRQEGASDVAGFIKLGENALAAKN